MRKKILYFSEKKKNPKFLRIKKIMFRKKQLIVPKKRKIFATA